MTYFIKTIVTGFFLLTFFTKTFAQPTFTLENVTASSGSSFCMEITTTELTDLFALDFSINWDPTILELTSTQSLNANLSGANVTTTGSSSGVMTFSFFGGPLTINEGEVVIELCFDVLATTGGFADVQVTNSPTFIDVGTFFLYTCKC